jgi:hypothetical protein
MEGKGYRNLSEFDYLPDSGLGAGLAVGRGFLAGLETPKLIRRKPRPLRRESITFMGAFLSEACGLS